MDRHVDEAMVRRLVACVVLAAIFFSLGLSIGQSRDTAPEPALPLSGEELWQSLPFELLANVAEGIMERISGLEDDLERVGEIQREKMQNMSP